MFAVFFFVIIFIVLLTVVCISIFKLSNYSHFFSFLSFYFCLCSYIFGFHLHTFRCPSRTRTKFGKDKAE
jgi:hypothetical protein